MKHVFVDLNARSLKHGLHDTGWAKSRYVHSMIWFNQKIRLVTFLMQTVLNNFGLNLNRPKLLQQKDTSVSWYLLLAYHILQNAASFFLVALQYCLLSAQLRCTACAHIGRNKTEFSVKTYTKCLQRDVLLYWLWYKLKRTI